MESILADQVANDTICCFLLYFDSVSEMILLGSLQASIVFSCLVGLVRLAIPVDHKKLVFVL